VTRVRLAAAALAALLGAAAVAAAQARGGQASLGAPPPEWAANAASWPSHNEGLANARANLHSLIDVCFKGSATGLVGAGNAKPAGGLAATVANDVVFTSTFDGTIYAFSAKTGATLWKTKASAGINSFPAVTQTMLIVGAGARTSTTTAPKGEIVAYALPRG
jgi:outer membrane protein assembly factor BamB